MAQILLQGGNRKGETEKGRGMIELANNKKRGNSLRGRGHKGEGKSQKFCPK